MTKKIYPSLNGLRVISITLVLLHHLALKSNLFQNLSSVIWFRPVTDLLTDGHMGVNVFFIISGFLITSLMLTEEVNTKTLSLKKFYIKRILRIFPAYYFLLLVYFILQLLKIIYMSEASWITALTYTKYFNWDLDWFSAHLWSLSVEEHFYILFPLIFISGNKLRKWITFFLVLIVPVMRTYLHYFPTHSISEMHILTRIDAIAIGCLCAFYKDEIIEKFKGYWVVLFYISVICLFVLRYCPSIVAGTVLSYIFIPLGSTHGTIANLFIAVIIMYSVFGPHKVWFKFLNLKWMNYIGILSYSIYLWQQLFISGMKYFFTKFPLNILFILVIALISYNVIEKPFLKLKAKL